MIAGLLVSLVLVFLLCPQRPSQPVARAVAWGTLAMGFGGSMTYGQTIGLTQDGPLIGQWAALGWGMLGLAIKGGLWIGFAGAFLGMGLGGLRYRPVDLLLVWLGMLALVAVGIWVLNEPFDPARRVLPPIYFSDDWRWEPTATLKPRREVWGGLFFALTGLLAYLHWGKRDPLATRLALWGVLGGALGFPLGQCLPAFHAWNPEIFRTGFWVTLDPLLNWWNFMETTFGAVMGAALGLGLSLHRQRLHFPEKPEFPLLPQPLELALLGLHLFLLISVEFLSIKAVDRLYDFGLGLGLIPVVAVAGGRWWPWLVMLPITLLPIAVKTRRALLEENPLQTPEIGGLIYVVLPLAFTTAAAIYLGRTRFGAASSATWLGPVLLATTWLYFGLNFAFFRFPWPWQAWTARTPNGLVFSLCAVGLTWAALSRRPSKN